MLESLFFPGIIAILICGVFEIFLVTRFELNALWRPITSLLITVVFYFCWISWVSSSSMEEWIKEEGFQASLSIWGFIALTLLAVLLPLFSGLRYVLHDGFFFEQNVLPTILRVVESLIALVIFVAALIVANSKVGEQGLLHLLLG